jgi:peptidoglycan hydrolase CwlO-like protein
MSTSRRPVAVRILAALLALAAVGYAVVTHTPSAKATPSVGALSNQLSNEQARQQRLSSSVSSLSGMISSLTSQISFVQTREADMRQQLSFDRVELAKVTADLERQRARVAVLRKRLDRSRMLLARQLLSNYEGNHPDLVSVVLNANGFNNLLEQISFLGRAEHAQQTIIALTKAAKAQATAAENQYLKLEARDVQITQSAAVRVRALEGMNALLSSRQAALSRARSAQQIALEASRARAAALQSRINRIRAAQLAAQARAAAAAAAAANSAPSYPTGSSAVPSSGWAIPYPIVLCESGGQNLPPNSAGASGYYQIMPATWRLFGGTGPAAYLASKAEQDAVASRIWNGGAGASNWVCAGIVGIH